MTGRQRLDVGWSGEGHGFVTVYTGCTYACMYVCMYHIHLAGCQRYYGDRVIIPFTSPSGLCWTNHGLTRTHTL